MAKRQRQRTERTRLALLSAARELFRERGYEGVTVAEIADRAERAHGTFYLYFDNKLDVFSALLAEMGDEITQRARETWTGDSVVDAVWQGVRNFFITSQENADLWHLLETMAAVDSSAAQLRYQLRESFTARIQRGIELSRTPATQHLDPTVLAHVLTAMVFRFARLGQLPAEAGALALHVTVLWARGLGYPEDELADLEQRVLSHGY